MNFSFKRPEDSPGFLLWQLTNQWQRNQRLSLAKLCITHPQFVVLAVTLWLSNTTNKCVTQKQVSDLSKIDKMTVSDVVKTLLRKKLLHRSLHKEDGRAYALSLTPTGRTKVLKAIPIVEEVDKKFFIAENTELVLLLKNLAHLA